MRKSRRTAKSAILVLVLSICVATTAGLAGFGHQWGWWHFGQGFKILRWAVYAAVLVLGTSVFACIAARPGGPKRGFVMAVLALMGSLPVLVIPAMELQAARSLPPIHDISTDTNEPPVFKAIVTLRANAPNPLVYPGEGTANQQRNAYPDIKPLVWDHSTTETFTKAMAAAKKLGWEIVSTDANSGRIEATATTFWFGFKDDVVIRIQATTGGSRLDIRSVSRVGVSDVGANAQRIRKFLHALQ